MKLRLSALRRRCATALIAAHPRRRLGATAPPGRRRAAGEDQGQDQGPAAAARRRSATGSRRSPRSPRSCPTRRSRSASATAATRSSKSTPYVRQVKGKKFGRVKLRSKALLEPGKYLARVSKAATGQQAGGVGEVEEVLAQVHRPRSGRPRPGGRSSSTSCCATRATTTPTSTRYGSHTERAVLAFRKVNGMERTFNAEPDDLQDARRRQGRLQAEVRRLGQARRGRHLTPGDGARQRRRGRSTSSTSRPAPRPPPPTRAVHLLSQGPRLQLDRACTTRSITTAARRPTATHSVPTYPASHGCIRNPIPDSVFIYNWIDFGDKMYVYV